MINGICHDFTGLKQEDINILTMAVPNVVSIKLNESKTLWINPLHIETIKVTK